MTLPNITILSFGIFEQELLKNIAFAVQTEYGYPVNIQEAHLDISEFYDPARRQYNGNELLKVIDTISLSDSIKKVGLFQVDLFIPILTFIFGQAFLNGSCAIASVYRLYNERYGMNQNKPLLFERTKKEVIHELGHTFGLLHCDNPICVMRSSTYLEDVDQKRKNLCQNCQIKLELKGIKPIKTDQ
jgi:archaemetzincin